jgi:hypothetical protein
MVPPSLDLRPGLMEIDYLVMPAWQTWTGVGRKGSKYFKKTQGSHLKSLVTSHSCPRHTCGHRDMTGHSGLSSSKQPDIIIFANFFRPKYQF